MVSTPDFGMLRPKGSVGHGSMSEATATLSLGGSLRANAT